MIVVDASVWVASFQQADIHYLPSRLWLGRQAESEQQLLAPIIVLAEVAGALVRITGDPAIAAQAMTHLIQAPDVELAPIDNHLGLVAARLAIDLQLRGADSIYVAVAKEFDVPLVTWDREQLDRAASIISVMTPQPDRLDR